MASDGVTRVQGCQGYKVTKVTRLARLQGCLVTETPKLPDKSSDKYFTVHVGENQLYFLKNAPLFVSFTRDITCNHGNTRNKEEVMKPATIKQ